MFEEIDFDYEYLPNPLVLPEPVPDVLPFVIFPYLDWPSFGIGWCNKSSFSYSLSCFPILGSAILIDVSILEVMVLGLESPNISRLSFEEDIVLSSKERAVKSMADNFLALTFLVWVQEKPPSPPKRPVKSIWAVTFLRNKLMGHFS